MLKAFLLAHIKSLLSFGFFCGVTPWILKLLDKKLTKDQKDRFGVWINGLVPRIDGLHPNDLFMWAKENPRKYKVIFYISTTIVLISCAEPVDVFHRYVSYADPTHSRLWLDLLAITAIFGFFIAMAILFSSWVVDSLLQRVTLADALRNSWREWAEVLIGFYCLTAFSFVCWSIMWAVNIERKPFMELTDGWWGYVLLVVRDVPLIALYIAGIAVAPLVLIALLRFPITWVSNALWWLATHPKGAWAAMLLAVTTGLSLLRIFF